MDYFLWSQEYFEEAEKIKRNLFRMRKNLQTVASNKRRTLEDNIEKLQLIYYECLNTANYLEKIARSKQNAA